MKTERNFPKIPSKILLFGEYTTLKGSMALAAPFWSFYGQLSVSENNGNETCQRSHEALNALYHFLKKAKIGEKMNLEQFEADLQRGLHFQSNIPQGYGLGSSGAVTAAIWKAYAQPSANLAQQKTDLAGVEAFFHGTSSGIDPLVSYQNQALLFTAHEIKPVQDIVFPDDIKVYLTDTHTPRNTQGLVQKFLNDCKASKYKTFVKEEIIPATNRCIEALTGQTYASFWHHLHALSELQLKHLHGAIPESIRERWKEGLKSKKYFMKLCGAGGGGYVLGFSKSEEVDYFPASIEI